MHAAKEFIDCDASLIRFEFRSRNQNEAKNVCASEVATKLHNKIGLASQLFRCSV